MILRKKIPLIDQHDRYGFWGGKFGGSFIPETLKKPVEDLTKEFSKLRNNKKVLTVLFFTTLLLKLVLLLLPTDMWKLCYQDDLITRFPGEIGQTIDNQLECEKVYHLNVQNNSSLAREINFYSDPNSEWLGANGSNFNLSFLVY